jgi:glycine/D-amino acid oxidase-like deaminating enzyme
MTFWHHFLGLSRVCGVEEALRLARASTDAVAEIGQFCHTHGIDADFRPDGWLWAATNEAERGAWDSTVAALEPLGERPFVSLSGEERVRRSGSARHLDGVLEAGAATVHPGRLVRGLARVAVEKGVRIFERSPMSRLHRSSPLSVETPRGNVVADKVVLALNAWSAKVPGLRRAFVTVSSDIVITEPAPEGLRRIGWTDGLSISDSRLRVHYYRTTSDGRVALGKGGLALAFGDRVGLRSSPGRAAVAAARLFELYPSLSSAGIAGYWTGPIDRTVDSLPFFTTLGRPDVVCGAGYSGNGVGPSFLGGRILASLALGLDDEWSRCGLVRSPPGSLPPEPVRYVGGQIVKRAVARNELAAEQGRKPHRIDVALASLAPAGLVPLE